jgi:hypothetical protein
MVIKVEFADGTISDCDIEAAQSPPWSIVFSGCGFDGKPFLGQDLFEALANLRRDLEKSHRRILCAGARVDVFPSAMCRSMGGGRKAYILRSGTPTKTGDLIDIFDYAPPELVGTVEQQRANHRKWLDGLRENAELARPSAGEVSEAKRNANGWVYRVAGVFQPNEKIPPDAIVGAWKVNDVGKIVGGFIKNANYDPIKWPRKRS